MVVFFEYKAFHGGNIQEHKHSSVIGTQTVTVAQVKTLLFFFIKQKSQFNDKN